MQQRDKEQFVRTDGKRTRRFVAIVAVGALALTACGGDDEGGGEGAEGTGEVSLLHAIAGTEEQAALQAALDAFEESTGNTVTAEFTDDIATTLGIRVDGGDPPDVVLHPQPGALEGLAGEGQLTSLEDVGIDGLDGLVPGMVETGTFDDTSYGVVVKAAVSSLLWYRADVFEEAGYEEPDSWSGMMDLTQTIADSGTTPWCIGIESGGATGWVATNWIEDAMLRLHGPDVYDQWVQGELDFSSPEVTEAFELVGEIFLNEEYVLGGPTGITNTPFAEAAAPMFQDPPACLLHRQAGFIEGEFDGEFGTEYSVTIMPPVEDQGGAVFSGDVAAVLTDNATAGELVEFLVSSEGQEAWHSHDGSGSLSVRSDFDTSLYPNDSLARQGELLANAEVARFDGSDLMPSAVGGEAFFAEISAWISGQDLETTLSNIDAAWPEG
ncbi:MAG: ABC transporter substrate-binding protein [Actinobacteria bacterium]|nr:ABC transporter substrate-binding protein [Actinomycetota bacterium]